LNRCTDQFPPTTTVYSVGACVVASLMILCLLWYYCIPFFQTWKFISPSPQIPCRIAIVKKSGHDLDSHDDDDDDDDIMEENNALILPEMMNHDLVLSSRITQAIQRLKDELYYVDLVKEKDRIKLIVLDCETKKQRRLLKQRMSDFGVRSKDLREKIERVERHQLEAKIKFHSLVDELCMGSTEEEEEYDDGCDDEEEEDDDDESYLEINFELKE